LREKKKKKKEKEKERGRLGMRGKKVEGRQ
jgi:hypothetical protein